jgi:SAM-dependent methyltransferase
VLVVDDVSGARSFGVAGAAYDSFMGRYSSQLAPQFAEAASVASGHTVIDVGCGPGALTDHLVTLLGPAAVRACDPSPTFVQACSARHPGVAVMPGRAESIPFPTGEADHAMAQLVLHFVSDPEQAAREMGRVVRPGGRVSACVWDFDEGMEMLRRFWDAALTIDPAAPDEARTLRFGKRGEIADLFAGAGLTDVAESNLRVTSTYRSFDELWSGFLAGVGPAGSYCVGLGEGDRDRLRRELFHQLGSPAASFTLGAVARCAVGTVPS